jgi:hypothetical protein
MLFAAIVPTYGADRSHLGLGPVMPCILQVVRPIVSESVREQTRLLPRESRFSRSIHCSLRLVDDRSLLAGPPALQFRSFEQRYGQPYVVILAARLAYNESISKSQMEP